MFRKNCLTLSNAENTKKIQFCIKKIKKAIYFS